MVFGFGNSIKFGVICFRTGRPEPTVSWFNGSEPIQTTGGITMGRHVVVNRLEIPHLTRDAYNSTLRCQASNTKLAPPVERIVRLDMLRKCFILMYESIPFWGLIRSGVLVVFWLLALVVSVARRRRKLNPFISNEMNYLSRDTHQVIFQVPAEDTRTQTRKHCEKKRSVCPTIVRQLKT